MTATMSQEKWHSPYKLIRNEQNIQIPTDNLFVLTGKVAESALVSAGITCNKNMVPFDSRSAFQTSGIRLGTPAITTRGAKEDLMVLIAELIEEVLNAPEKENVIANVRNKVKDTMKDYPLFFF